jgi:AraC-like DNA-binding protein
VRKTENPNTSAVQQMKQYIAEHLQEPITASSLAKAADYSQYHAARIFKEEVGSTPFEYIRRQRLIASAHALRGNKARILDIALDYAFDSHEGFTRAFTSCFGISPKKYAATGFPECGRIIARYLHHPNSKSEVHNMNTTSVIFTQIIERPARKLLLKRSKAADDYFSYVAEVGCGNQNNSAPWDASPMRHIRVAYPRNLLVSVNNSLS